MELKLAMVIMRLFDVCTTPIDNMPHLIIIEQPGNLNANQKFLETIWHDLNYSEHDGCWEKTSSTIYTIPYGHTISAVRKNGTWIAVVESNMHDAFYFFGMGKDRKPPVCIPINLSRETWSQIEIPGSGEWSTLYLPTRKHLFFPQLFPLDDKKNIILANAPDASARILTIGTDIEETGRIEHCFEPRIIMCGEKRLVLAKQCPVGWSVFFNQPSTRTTPQLLPLYIYFLDNNFSVIDTVNLSKGWHTGPSFGFDVCTTGDGVIILASISGLLKKPYLHILLSRDQGKSWEERAMINLESVPQQVRVAAAGSRLLVACTFKKHDGYHVMAAEFDR